MNRLPLRCSVRTSAVIRRPSMFIILNIRVNATRVCRVSSPCATMTPCITCGLALTAATVEINSKHGWRRSRATGCRYRCAAVSLVPWARNEVLIKPEDALAVARRFPGVRGVFRAPKKKILKKHLFFVFSLFHLDLHVKRERQ